MFRPIYAQKWTFWHIFQNYGQIGKWNHCVAIFIGPDMKSSWKITSYLTISKYINDILWHAVVHKIQPIRKNRDFCAFLTIIGHRITILYVWNGVSYPIFSRAIRCNCQIHFWRCKFDLFYQILRFSGIFKIKTAGSQSTKMIKC